MEETALMALEVNLCGGEVGKIGGNIPRVKLDHDLLLKSKELCSY